MLPSAIFSRNLPPRPKSLSILAVVSTYSHLTWSFTLILTVSSSDVVPWQCWTRYPNDCQESRAVFVDVDFPDLIQKKRQVVLNTPELYSHLTNVQTGHDQQNVFSLRSDRYYQIGCDLRQTDALEKALASILNRQDCVFLFIAEVSITYMETETADPLIKWASSIGHGRLHSSKCQTAGINVLNSRVLSFGTDPSRWPLSSLRPDNARPFQQTLHPDQIGDDLCN